MKKGFTVIEVLVVIGIIAILTVIVFPSISNIRAKNRDAEKVADIAAIQLGLSLYYNQHPQEGYPKDIFNNPSFVPKYVPADALISPNSDPYLYIPLTKNTGSNPKCTFYHLGVELELPSAQIDINDKFSSASPISNDYSYCGEYSGPGLPAYNSVNNNLLYQVHP